MDLNDKTKIFTADDLAKAEAERMARKIADNKKALEEMAFLEKMRNLKNPALSIDEQEALMKELENKKKLGKEVFLSKPENKEWLEKLTKTQEENKAKALREEAQGLRRKDYAEAIQANLEREAAEKPQIIPSERQKLPSFPEEPVRDVDVQKFQKWQAREPELLKRIESTKLEPRYVEESLPKSSAAVAAEESALGRLGKGLGIASGVAGGALVAKDISENKPVEAALTGLETGLGYLGKTAGRAAPFLELLRATPTASEEQELSEIQKYRNQQEAAQQELAELDKWKNINSMLSKKSKKERDLASE